MMEKSNLKDWFFLVFFAATIFVEGSSFAQTVDVLKFMDQTQATFIKNNDVIHQDAAKVSQSINQILKKGLPPSTFYFPSGIYMISSNIECPNGVSLMGDANTIFKISANLINTNCIFIKGKKNIKIKGIKIIGSASEDTRNNEISGIGINIEGSSNISLENISVSGCWYGIRGAIDRASNTMSQNITVTGSAIKENIRNGIVYDGVLEGKIKNNKVYDNGKAPSLKLGSSPGHGIVVMSYFGESRNINIEGNESFGNRGNGIMIWASRRDKYVYNTSITNNKSYGNRFSGIIVNLGFNTKVIGNESYNNNRKLDYRNNSFRPYVYGINGIHIEVGSRNTEVKGNLCYETNSYNGSTEELQCAGIACGAGYPLDKEPAPINTIIANNVCYNNKRFQKSVAGAPNYKYTNIQIDGDRPEGRHRVKMLYRDGRDNIEIDKYVLPTLIMTENRFEKRKVF